jgi:putative membrane protein
MMGLFWVVILIPLVVLVVWLVSSRPFPWISHESPEAILKRRYARGEISKEQYENMLRDLRR